MSVTTPLSTMMMSVWPVREAPSVGDVRSFSLSVLWHVVIVFMPAVYRGIVTGI
jgi:hypothetical protein